VEGDATGTWTTLREARDRLEKEMVTSALDQSGGQIKEAAATLGLSRPGLNYLLSKHHLQADLTDGIVGR